MQNLNPIFSELLSEQPQDGLLRHMYGTGVYDLPDPTHDDLKFEELEVVVDQPTKKSSMQIEPRLMLSARKTNLAIEAGK